MVVVHAVIEERARAALRILARRAQVRAAYLFGSRIEGTADEWSDIDIAAFIDKADQWDLQQRVDVCVEARQEVGDDVELHLFPAESLKNPPRASFAQYILRHGARLDIDGIDAAHKLAILAALAFGREVDFASVHVEGIRHISLADIRFAEELGYRIKLLGVATASDKGIEQRVHPCMVPVNAAIAGVEGVFNAVVAEGDFIDTLMLEGRGAGAGPTASAIAADLVDIARQVSIPTFGVPVDQLLPSAPVAMSGHSGAYYIRLMVLDQPGVFADVASVLRDNNVSMESILQHGRAPGEPVPVILTLHETLEAQAVKTIQAIAALDGVVEPPVMIRMENL